MVSRPQGADAAGLAFDAIAEARQNGSDVVIIDTAGRLQNRAELMDELAKVIRVVKKAEPGAPHAVLLVLDATTGQNAVAQAQHFTKAVAVTGLFLAKLDGTAKGGIVISIRSQLKIPVKFIGLGETPQDIESFDPARFIDALFGDRQTAS